MISPKGREEIRRLIASALVEDWAATDRSLKNVLRMLLSQRPDLVKLYFLPEVWAKIIQLDRKESAAVILALFRATVIEEAGVPAIANWEQARFYLGSRMPRFMDMAETWCTRHPEACRGRLNERRPAPLPLPMQT